MAEEHLPSSRFADEYSHAVLQCGAVADALLPEITIILHKHGCIGYSSAATVFVANTHDDNERDVLVSAGWNDEGIGWYSDDAETVPLYRDYNPNAFANNHNYTTDADEYGFLISLDWREEGFAWYGV